MTQLLLPFNASDRPTWKSVTDCQSSYGAAQERRAPAGLALRAGRGTTGPSPAGWSRRESTTYRSRASSGPILAVSFSRASSDCQLLVNASNMLQTTRKESAGVHGLG